MDDLIRHLARRDVSRPTYHARRPDAALHGRIVKAAPGAGRASPGTAGLRPVVRAPHHDRVAFDTEAFDRVEHKAGIMVDVRHRVADIACPGTSGKIGMGQCRKMYLSDRIVKEERFARLYAPLHKADAPERRLAVDRAAGFKIEGLDLRRWRARFTFPDIRDLGLSRF